MHDIAPNTPILVGAGQCVDHWDGCNAAAAPSPQSLMSKAARRALEDCGAHAIADSIDVIAVTRLFADSMSGVRGAEKFGTCENLPRYVGRENGISPRRAIYSVVGGQAPQAMVSEFAEDIHAGRAQAVLLTGGEAIAAAKMALRQGMTLDWHDACEGELEDRGFGSHLLNGYEMANGIGAPAHTYPLFENALRARRGKSREEHAADMAMLWHRFSKVAAANPYAQFRQERGAEFLMAPSAENYPIAEPYLKWHVAQDAVNQGAALILTSVGKARELGIAADKWIYLHSYAAANEQPVSQRADLSRSLAAEGVLKLALETAGKSARDMAHMDLYSCFPCAVFIAAEALGVDWRDRDLTVTGGLPFFGGAGNNYTMHAIAEMVTKLRANPDDFGLIAANGGFLSKQTAGIYSAQPTHDWQPVSSAAIQAHIDAEAPVATISQDTTAQIESYTVTYRKGAADRAIVTAIFEGNRIVARTASNDASRDAVIAALLDPEHDPACRTANIRADERTNIITAIS